MNFRSTKSAIEEVHLVDNSPELAPTGTEVTNVGVAVKTVEGKAGIIGGGRCSYSIDIEGHRRT